LITNKSLFVASSWFSPLFIFLLIWRQSVYGYFGDNECNEAINWPYIISGWLCMIKGVTWLYLLEISWHLHWNFGKTLHQNSCQSQKSMVWWTEFLAATIILPNIRPSSPVEFLQNRILPSFGDLHRVLILWDYIFVILGRNHHPSPSLYLQESAYFEKCEVEVKIIFKWCLGRE